MLQRNLILLGAVIVIAGTSLGTSWTNNTVADTPELQANRDNQKIGETNMLTATKSQGTVHHANDSNFSQLVLNSDVPVLVDFYADWCGPCRMLAPLLEELAKETSDAKIVKVNVDHAPQLARRYGIQSIPSLKVFDGGEVVDEHVGLANKGQLKSMLDI
jgi:thioredoxin 1